MIDPFCRPDRARFGQQNGIVSRGRHRHSVGALTEETRVTDRSSRGRIRNPGGSNSRAPSTRFAGRILVGLGYDVVLVEPADGDPSRHESAGTRTATGTPERSPS